MVKGSILWWQNSQFCHVWCPKSPSLMINSGIELIVSCWNSWLMIKHQEWLKHHDLSNNYIYIYTLMIIYIHILVFFKYIYIYINPTHFKPWTLMFQTLSCCVNASSEDPGVHNGAVPTALTRRRPRRCRHVSMYSWCIYTIQKNNDNIYIYMLVLRYVRSWNVVQYSAM